MRISGRVYIDGEEYKNQVVTQGVMAILSAWKNNTAFSPTHILLSDTIKGSLVNTKFEDYAGLVDDTTYFTVDSMLIVDNKLVVVTAVTCPVTYTTGTALLLLVANGNEDGTLSGNEKVLSVLGIAIPAGTTRTITWELTLSTE